jgi:hypothetical protein
MDPNVNAKVRELAKQLKITEDQALTVAVMKGIESLGASAFAQGTDISFSGSSSGQIMAHEATHMVQQKQGRP